MPKESYDLLYNICALNNRQLNGVVLASKIANNTYTKYPVNNNNNYNE